MVNFQLSIRFVVIIIALFYNKVGNSTEIKLKKKFIQKHYTPVEYNWSAQIISITEDTLGYKYFGTKNGILTFNGKKWDKYYTENSIWKLKSSNGGNIFVGSSGSFGILKRDSIGLLDYQSISDSIQEELITEDFRFIEVLGHHVFFASEKLIFSYNIQTKHLEKLSISATNSNSTIINLKSLDQKLYVSLYNLGLFARHQLQF